MQISSPVTIENPYGVDYCPQGGFEPREWFTKQAKLVLRAAAVPDALRWLRKVITAIACSARLKVGISPIGLVTAKAARMARYYPYANASIVRFCRDSKDLLTGTAQGFTEVESFAPPR